MVPPADPKVDYAFKKIFGSEENVPVLQSVLEAVLQPPADRPLVSLQIQNPFNDKQALDDKLSILDIKARDGRGGQYNIEMQMIVPRLFPPRALYYWARLHSQQLSGGEKYVALQPTISICFVNGVLFRDVADFHLDFKLRSSAHPKLVFSEHQVIHLIELPKFKKRADELETPLDVWCYFLIHGAELDLANLPAALRTPPVVRATEVLKMLTQDDLERERYESRLKAQRDYYSYLEDARVEAKEEGKVEGRVEGREEGLKEGLEKGNQQGIEKGEILGRIRFCQRLLKLPLTPRDELLALTLVDLYARAAALEQQIGILGS